MKSLVDLSSWNFQLSQWDKLPSLNQCFHHCAAYRMLLKLISPVVAPRRSWASLAANTGDRVQTNDLCTLKVLFLHLMVRSEYFPLRSNSAPWAHRACIDSIPFSFWRDAPRDLPLEKTISSKVSYEGKLFEEDEGVGDDEGTQLGIFIVGCSLANCLQTTTTTTSKHHMRSTQLSFTSHFNNDSGISRAI